MLLLIFICMLATFHLEWLLGQHAQMIRPHSPTWQDVPLHFRTFHATRFLPSSGQITDQAIRKLGLAQSFQVAQARQGIQTTFRFQHRGAETDHLHSRAESGNQQRHHPGDDLVPSTTTMTRTTLSQLTIAQSANRSRLQKRDLQTRRRPLRLLCPYH